MFTVSFNQTVKSFQVTLRATGPNPSWGWLDAKGHVIPGDFGVDNPHGEWNHIPVGSEFNLGSNEYKTPHIVAMQVQDCWPTSAPTLFP